MSRSFNGTCADCGRPMYLSTGSLPQGKARCQPCRRGARASSRECDWCGQTYERRLDKLGKYCSRRCSNRALSAHMQIRPLDDVRVKRTQREHAAPGLSAGKRYSLRDKWIKQGKRCAYCASAADTIDHVVPLVRGGTNYEGNLVVCCRSCNSSKAGSTIVEWRTGRRLPRMTTAITWPEHPKREARTNTVRQTPACAICSTPTHRGKYCSPACATESQRRRMRDKYRASVGLPVDPNKPTSKFVSRFVLRT